jgi:RNA-directed DNA polymerase
MNSAPELADRLANALVAGSLTRAGVLARAETACGRRYRWFEGLADRLSAKYVGRTRPTSRQLAKWLLADAGFQWGLARNAIRIAATHVEQATMVPASFARDWQVPALVTERELATWLELSPARLIALADLTGHSARAMQEPHRHYRYRHLTKPGGTVRLIEAPKPRLRVVQQKILRGILEHIPLHAAVHGFRREHNPQTFALPHVRQRVVIRVDLADYFPSILSSRVGGIFRAAGYPESVTELLVGLTTNTAPAGIFPSSMPRHPERDAQVARYRRPHLPQGASTSPYLANLAAFGLDQRLTGLARACEATYTRYADDLAFSGGERLSRGAKTFCVHVAAIAMEEGFGVNFRKTRVMRRGVRQQLAGIVVNEYPNIRRDDFDQLKAILYNCARSGLESQNRDGHPEWHAHLQGRVAHVSSINPARGAKLQKLLDRAMEVSKRATDARET